jgi:hypothetical protein
MLLSRMLSWCLIAASTSILSQQTPEALRWGAQEGPIPHIESCTTMSILWSYALDNIVSNSFSYSLSESRIAGHWWLTRVILATQKAEIRRITVQSQPQQTVHKTLSQKKKKKTKKKVWWSGLRCRPWVQTLVPQNRVVKAGLGVNWSASQLSSAILTLGPVFRGVQKMTMQVHA